MSHCIVLDSRYIRPFFYLLSVRYYGSLTVILCEFPYLEFQCLSSQKFKIK